MQNKVLTLLRRYSMLAPGDDLTCAVSGGPDSMALLWCMYLLREKLDLRLSAAHFNHGLRGAESDRDEEFVRAFCRDYQIPLAVARGRVEPGGKGLEAAAREARYAFFDTLPGKIATAHTADDNAETVLLRLVRGTGLRGLGAIAPVRGRILRPMLLVTRQEVLAFLKDQRIDYVTDSTNDSDRFLRNRLRSQVMPLLYRENPRLGEDLSAMALRLREEEALLSGLSVPENSVSVLRAMPQAQRNRCLAALLEAAGVPEPTAEHIALAEKLVFSEKPGARGLFPGGVILAREYDTLTVLPDAAPPAPAILPETGTAELPDWGLRVTVLPGDAPPGPGRFQVCPEGPVLVRSREPGDEMRLPGGRKTLKKLFIDRKIPAARRCRVPVLADQVGVLGVFGLGVNLDRAGPGRTYWIEPMVYREKEI